MQLKLLGTGGYHPNAVRHTASFLLPEQNIAFDAGTGIYRLPEAFPGQELHLFLTHPHWDHIIGLTYLYVPMLLQQWERVTIYANQRTLAAIKTHLFAESTFAHMPDFELQPLEDYPGELQIGDCLVRWMPLVGHPGGSVAYRVEHPESTFAYISDTYVDGTYQHFLEGVGTLLHECYFDDDMQDWAKKTGHSYLSQVVDLGCALRIDQLLLTHPDPRIAAQEPFDLTQARQRIPRISFAQDQTSVDLRTA